MTSTDDKLSTQALLDLLLSIIIRLRIENKQNIIYCPHYNVPILPKYSVRLRPNFCHKDKIKIKYLPTK